MSNNGRRIDLHVTDADIKEPQFWLTEGSRWRRSAEALELSEDGEVNDALPKDRTREIPVLFRQVLALTPGEWNGLKDVWTPELIAACAANHSKPRPLQKDHSRDADHNHGKVLDLLHLPAGAAHPTKDALVALIGVIGAHGIERVEDGRWDEFSVGVWAAKNVEESYLQELSFTKFPACDDVMLLHQMEEKKEKEGADVPNEDDKVQGAEAAHEPKKEVAELSKGHGEVAELRAELEKQREEMAQLRQEAAQAKQLRLEESVGGQLVTLTREGFSSPAVFEDEKAFVVSLADDDARSAYYALCRAKGQVWRPGRQSDPALSLSKDVAEEAQTDAEAAEIKALIRK